MTCKKCDCPATHRGHCARCYYRAKVSGEIQSPIRAFTVGVRCTGPGCSRGVVTADLCAGHYSQRRKGKPLTPLKAKQYNTVLERESATDKVWARVELEIANGTRCSCGLLGKCDSHETLSLEWNATRRIGAAGGET